jgi:hypothetical protein
MRGEEIFASTKERFLKSAVDQTPDQTAVEQESIEELRKDLNKLLEWQADTAPNSLSLEDAYYPVREGNLFDLLSVRVILKLEGIGVIANSVFGIVTLIPV